MATPLEHELAYLQAEEAAPPVRLYNGIMLLIASRGCKVDSPKDLSREKFLHDFGRGPVQIACTRNGSSDRFLILILPGYKVENIEPLLASMDSKMRAEPKARDYKIDTLIVHETEKYTKRPAFEKYGVTETTKTFAQIICNPIQHICAAEARIVPKDKLTENMLQASNISTKLRDDPLVYWLWAKPGDIIEERGNHENAGKKLEYYKVI